MKIETKRLTLVPSTPESVSRYAEGNELGKHIFSYLKKLENNPDLYGWGVWLVIENESGNLAGDIGFKGKPDAARTVEIGYGIIPLFRGKGYATESVKSLIDWAFATGEVDKVTAECLQDNLPSIKVLNKCFMEYTHKDGDMLKWKLEKTQ
ncbi:GNAT family N-acetyltransferase [Mesobacillus zeae]|uniref:N-acetyltransferase n=1 Tax=Mesobacillus zeae TaxID=1917180 RepID=A0A398AX37_9BACI|nr:GNAT family N-acetyltransferase [Mesobacillus zeae]RID82229.1 N-acetyltransferase [Mesobacillus zeae]